MQVVDADDMFIRVKLEKPVDESRQCVLCYGVGDGETDTAGRFVPQTV